MAAARQHVEEIRRTKFSIGGEPNPLTEDLHQAVKNLSAELYAKDVHFLMELIQNAEDNEYAEGVEPSLEFVITSKDITGSGASATLLVFNNEKGFSPKNIDSICSVGRSTKKGLRKRGYIGEKGIGFKSVFLITAQPYIFSNGYQIRFSEKPCPECNVGYIVPEWVENPTLSVIQSIYGTGAALPTTTVVLPLKLDKVKPVKEQLSNLHPEVLLFLSKIRRLSVREDNEDPRLNTVSAISISSEINFITRKNIDAESYMLHLSADEIGDNLDRECGYHMWRQRFPVKHENRSDMRMEVEEWVITLAFPNGKRLNRGKGSPGIYAFLPTETVTNFPFIIQADFLLASSRENILWDNKWNQGILGCVPLVFLDAFTTLVKSTESAPVSSLPRMFGFLPVHESSHPKLNSVRELIREKLMGETIVPCESYMEQKIFRKPCEVGRLKPDFWSILNKAKSLGVSLSNISSHGRYIISYSFDKSEYTVILDFLGVEPVDDEWYAKCIQSSNLVMGVSEDVYIKLLQFIAEKWRSTFQKTNMKNIPLLQYIGLNDNVSLCSISDVSQASGKKTLLSTNSCYISWLVKWNREFVGANNCFFLKLTQEATEQCSCLLTWLKDEVRVRFVNVFDYANELSNVLKDDRRLVVAYAHLLFHSLAKNFLRQYQVEGICKYMPLVDKYGRVSKKWSWVLVPANGSKWVELIGSSPWTQEGYIELGEDYLCPAYYAGTVTPPKDLIKFLKAYVAASDVPDLSPANAAIPTMSAPLTKQNVFLLLTWIRNLRRTGTHLPERFLSSIKDGSWLRISLSGSTAYRPPSQSFMLASSQGHLLQNGSVLVDIPLIDQRFYGHEINEYKEELRTIGVMFDNREACQFIGKRLMSLAASMSITRSNVLSILKFIKFLRDNYLSPEDFINSITSAKWMRTSRGDMAPGQSILLNPEWNAASQISNLPFIDEGYYGKEVLSFKTELQLLGVIVGFGQKYDFVVDNLKSPSQLTSLTVEAALLILDCMRKSNSPDKLIKVLKDSKCLKSNSGYRFPSECFLFDPESEWGCLLQVFSSFPLIDEKFYGRTILSFKKELKQIGVIVDFEEAAKKFSYTFKELARVSSINRENVFSFLKCYKKLKKAKVKFPSDLKNGIREAKWLRTRLGDYRSPNECILFSADWKSISKISLLPFIDDSENCLGKDIHEYKQELGNMGVVTDLEGGAMFVAAGLCLPRNPSEIAPESVYSLLKCIRILLENREEFPVSFNKKIAQKWLKTRSGYSLPENCLLFDADWNPYLKLDDGPFIDDEFFGHDIKFYKKELSALGVTVDVEKGCQLLANHLVFHSDFSAISRIYACLWASKWEAENEDCKRIWIPVGDDEGEWVGPNDCVLYDQRYLFGQQLEVLEKYYDEKLLSFFGKVFRVKVHPSVDDFCKLWKVWEGSDYPLSHVECCAFWEYVVNNWDLKTEDIFAENLLKLPVHSTSGENGISLFNKNDVFIADDLYMKDLFENSSSRPLFVWYPQSSMKSLPRTKLIEVFTKIGVRTLSESVQKDLSAVDDIIEQKPVNPSEMFIKKGLFTLILGFLADPIFKIEAEQRQKAASRLLEVTVFETSDLISVGYSLSLSSGDIIKVNASQMIRWERQDLKVLMKKLDRSGGLKDVIEYASHFSEVVAEGVLWENEDLVEQLGELIRLGFLVEFDEAAVEFIMQKKNLQIFLEDQEFLSTNFPST